ncbi:MAG: LarC family nickel insertion protein, partial [Dehalococcoidia bacterium]
VVTVGSGTVVRSEHGVIPASPGPAGTEILENARFPLRFVDAAHELVTPTGAAILAAVAVPGQAAIVPDTHGVGAGSRDSPERPNAVRVFVGEAPAETSLPGGTRPLSLLEANIDDMTPALLANARDRLLEEGALDAWTEPIGMKKGRSATKLCALAGEGEEERLSRLMLAETSTLGVRVAAYRRYELERTGETRETQFGPVRVKVSVRDGIRRVMPEYDDVVAIARREGIPAREVQRRLEFELGEVERP